ncbi:MAG: hypothetical protein WCG92_04550, partial [Hyphomicrobiales bacterium]
MRKGVLAAIGLSVLAAVWSAAPARAMAISAPAALKTASDSVKVTEQVHCWDCGYWVRIPTKSPGYNGIMAPG